MNPFRHRLRYLIAALGLFLSPVAAQDNLRESEESRRISQSAASVATSNSMDILDDTRKLTIGDVLSFRIVEDGDPLTRLIVTDSGEVEIPYIGRVRAKDLTCAQVAKRAKVLLEKDYYYTATVLLGLDYNTYGSRTGVDTINGRKTRTVSAKTGYTIMGMVNTPGVFPLPEGETFTMSHAILRSGGFQRFANERKVRLLRKKPGNSEPITHTVNLHEIMNRGKISSDLPLVAGDVIIVDRKLFNF